MSKTIDTLKEKLWKTRIIIRDLRFLQQLLIIPVFQDVNVS